MLITLRAILLVLFIAAPFGEQPTTVDPYRAPAELAIDAVLSCPSLDDQPHQADIWTAARSTVAAPGTAADA